MQSTRTLKGKIKNLLLDVDGALFSSEAMIHGVYAEEFAAYKKRTGRPEKIPTLEEIVAQIGKPVKEIFQNLVPELPEAEQDELSEKILENLVRRIQAGEGEHFPGVRETIQNLRTRSLKIFTASNGRLPYIKAILETNQVARYFDDMPHVDQQNIHNKIELVAATLKANNLLPGETLVVGDRTSDRDAALENGCYFAACNYGHGEADEHIGAVLFLDRFDELEDLI